MKGQVRLGRAESPGILAHEVRSAILLFISLLDAKQRRLYAGLESLRVGRGGDAQIARLLDLDLHTVAKGRHQLQHRDLEIERVRRKGAGRHAIKRLQALMRYETAADPMTGLRWTRKATRKVARELQQEGIMVSGKSVARLLKKMGYSLRANRKKLALSGNGSTHERRKRDRQFRHICATRECFTRMGEQSLKFRC